ncbi:hypothetical protein M2163_003553 [Streptomyces sp. SAI-135]|uniref:hypothetical protein n=1 Tax=unclassified Streptomyces TaxID=2593676 RepID=UPI0024748CFC|nr:MULTISPECIES: hypothetical protein [unclassified Streptomyces]MDH6519462.1 hypothetical protein [Streptomyces sp. SAI-090]MDH6616445.1 hypothetical protein [Streptomyces sp. SAI-135]
MDEDKKKEAELPPLLSRCVDAAIWARTNSDLVWDRQTDGRFRAGLVLKFSASQSVMLKIEKNPGSRLDWQFGTSKPFSKLRRKPLR